MADFLHGLRTSEKREGLRPVQPIRTAVIGMIGTADPRSFDETLGEFTVNKLQLVNSPSEVAIYAGANIEGATLPKMLDAWADHGAGVVFMVNIFDPTIHLVNKLYETTFSTTGDTIDEAALGYLLNPTNYVVYEATTITNEAVTFTTDTVALAGTGYVLEGSVVVTNVAGTKAYKEDYDYVIDYTVTPGTITRTEWGAIAASGNVRVSYEHTGATYATPTDYTIDSTDPTNIRLIRIGTGTISAGERVFVRVNVSDVSAVQPSDYVGTIEADGTKTGLQLFLDCYPRFGFSPVFLIAGESYETAVAAEMEIMANKLRGFAIVDALPQAKVDDAINGRANVDGFVKNFFSSSNRRIGLYPQLKVLDTVTNQERLEPYSWRFAARWCKVINQNGYWFSPSNKDISGITGIEFPLNMSATDSSADNQLLNEVGITTFFANFGSGYLTWGNRSFQWPTDSFPDNFMSVRLVADVIHKSLERACLVFVDQPISLAVIDSIKETANSFFKTLKNEGALIDGVCTFDPLRNSVDQIALGKLVFNIRFMPPPPAELIEFESYIDINQLNSLLSSAS